MTPPPPPHRTPPNDRAPARVEAVRWRLDAPQGFHRRNAVLATDRLRKMVVNGLDVSRDPEDFLLEGHNPDAQTAARWGLHAHAHWLWTEREDQILDLALWVPAGLAAAQVRRVAAVTALPRYEFEPPGYSGGQVHLRALGSAMSVLADLGAGTTSRVWSSATPLLTTWHLKKGDAWGDVIRRFLDRELILRFGDEAAAVVQVEISETRDYRTRRWDAKFPAHPAFAVNRLVTDRPVAAPLCLGSLSHFGFGRMTPA